ncbi:MAG: hypothetical protein KBA32_12700, partial [Propionivibrio sp.]|nr:hypothetical protein [Propionivibrio sp.]
MAMGVLGDMFAARADLDAQYLTQAGHEVGVAGMGRASRFSWVVADHRAFLMAVERLDGRIHLQYPRHIKQRCDAGA